MGQRVCGRMIFNQLPWGGESPAPGGHGEQDGHSQGPDKLHSQVPLWREADGGDG